MPVSRHLVLGVHVRILPAVEAVLIVKVKLLEHCRVGIVAKSGRANSFF